MYSKFSIYWARPAKIIKCMMGGPHFETPSSHGQSSHKTIGILTKVFYIFGPNLVILA